MSDFRAVGGEDVGAGRAGVSHSSTGSQQILQVITALNLIRMSLGMYPPGHSRITESIDQALEMIQKIFRRKTELFIGFAGDSFTFGETASDKEKKNAAFRDYARCLNNLHVVNFTMHRSLKKKDLLEFNRILNTKPADIWALGKVEVAIAAAGVTCIKVKAIDTDQFRLGAKKEILQTRADLKGKDANFWQDFITHLTSNSLRQIQNIDIPTDQEKLDPAEAVRFINRQREKWPSAVLSYEKMLHEYLSEVTKGRQIGSEKSDALASVNSLIGDLHPELKKQLIDVVERQFTFHPDTVFSEEDLKCFPRDLFMEIIRRTDESDAQLSPALVNLLKKMTGIHEVFPSSDQAKEKEFSSKEMETLLKREEYEKYVPEDYDRLLKKAAESVSSDEDIAESQFPVQEYLKTFTHEHVEFRICQLVFCLMDEDLSAEDYRACSKRLLQFLPELLKTGQFLFLTEVLESLRRHGREKPIESIRQNALSLLRTLSEKESIAKYVTPFILERTGEPAVIAKFLLAGGIQHLSWLFDLYLDPKAPLSATIARIIKGFGRSATEEAVRRLPDRDSQTIIRLLTLIREMADKSVASSLNALFHHRDWTVRREVIKTLIEFDDPAVIALLRESLKAENHDEVMEAVGLSCRYRVSDLLEDLTSMLKTFAIRDENTILNEWIVGELAKTGHPSVIPHLERIAAAWFSLSPKPLSEMKLALYRQLRHFPKNQILKLLKIGNRSRNKEIRTISAKLLKSKE